MNEIFLTIKQFAIESIKKTCLVFNLIFVLMAIFFSVFGGHMRPSDDPYRPAFFFGILCVSLALIFTISDNINKLTKWKHWIVGSCLVVWCLFWIIYEIRNDSQGIASAFAFESLISGIAAWILCMIRFPKWVYASMVTVIFLVLVGYTIIAIALANIHC